MSDKEPSELARKIISAREYYRRWYLAINDGHPDGAHLWELDRILAEHIAEKGREAIDAGLASLERELADTKAKLEKAELSTQSAEAVIAMTISRLGGMVEGFPTQRINFLQRVDELVEKESQLDELREAAVK